MGSESDVATHWKTHLIIGKNFSCKMEKLYHKHKKEKLSLKIKKSIFMQNSSFISDRNVIHEKYLDYSLSKSV